MKEKVQQIKDKYIEKIHSSGFNHTIEDCTKETLIDLLDLLIANERS